jgi:ligand-binding sensor domain-containing protein/putative methionine-R-sulfoxide reductase with GAF domain/anti-sigma regulatory factor (Ser/Thr protein kinase)
MRYAHLIILFIGSIYYNCLFAQKSFNYTFRHIGLADGLLHNDVYSIVQDDRGFIWLTTPNGLQRYDGNSFLNYRKMPADPKDIRIEGTVLFADKKDKQLWVVGGTNQLQKIDIAKGKSTISSYDNYLKNNQSAFTKYTGANNTQWLLGNKMIYLYDSIAKKYTINNISIDPINIMVKDSINNYTWVASYTDLFLFDEKHKQVYSEKFNPINDPLLAIAAKERLAGLRYIMTDSRKDIWITTWHEKIYRYDIRLKKLITYSLLQLKDKQEGKPMPAAGVLASCIFEDSRHTIWVSTENTGLLRYNIAEDNFDYCTASEKNTKGIKYNFKIYTLLEDTEQNIWLGTDKGICIFNPYRQNLKAIRHEENNNNSLPKNDIACFLQVASGDIFIGTWGGGISMYDKNFNFKKNILFKNTIDGNRVWSLIQPDAETMWLGCQHGILIYYNLITGTSKTIQPPELEHETIRCMEKDSKGNIWFGLNNGKVAKWDKKSNSFLPYAGSIEKAAPMILNIFIDKVENCWASTINGLKQFDLEKRLFKNHWIPNENNKTSLHGKSCQGIDEYNDSTLVIGTVNGGLNFFNKKTNIFSHLTTDNGLPNNTIYAVKKDADGYVWLTTDYDLYKFNPATKKSICYSPDHDIVNAYFEAKQIYILQSGEKVTFTSAEVVSFPIEGKDSFPQSKPKTEITGFSIFDKTIFVDSLITQNKPVQLSYKDNFFTIGFASLLFSNQQQINYFYRLKGIDKDWVNAAAKRSANYTDLQPGEYLFEVRADDAGSIGEITSFKIIIKPPFWKTWWFISIISFCILLLSFLFIRGREKSFKTIAAEKLKVQQLNAEQYKNKLELEQIINYFTTSLIDKKTVDTVLWDVAKNLIGRLGFVDCMMYLWNDEKTKMIQKAGIGPKGSVEEMNKQYFDVLPGQGLVGFVMQTKEPVLIPDTSKDSRYRPDEMIRLSEITVPIIYNNELLGIIDSEHPEKNFYTTQHLQLLTTIATLVANKIKSIEAEQSLQQSQFDMYRINEQLSKTKLDALRSQMNPHFIFNSLNAIDNLIQTNQKEKATTYLARFAKLIRNVLDSSKNDVVAFQKDYETLQLYLQMEQFRCSDKFAFELQAEDELMYGDYKVLPLIVQPFVENAIHHGLLNKQDGNRKLMVTAILENDYIIYTITDNGVGREKAQQLKTINKPEHQSYGIDITEERIQLYNQDNKNNNVIITDLFEKNKPSGTNVVIRIKTF